MKSGVKVFILFFLFFCVTRTLSNISCGVMRTDTWDVRCYTVDKTQFGINFNLNIQNPYVFFGTAVLPMLFQNDMDLESSINNLQLNYSNLSSTLSKIVGQTNPVSADDWLDKHYTDVLLGVAFAAIVGLLVWNVMLQRKVSYLLEYSEQLSKKKNRITAKWRGSELQQTTTVWPIENLEAAR